MTVMRRVADWAVQMAAMKVVKMVWLLAAYWVEKWVAVRVVWLVTMLVA